MKHYPYIEASFRKFEVCKIVDLGAIVDLPQTRKRSIVSNVPIKLGPRPQGKRTSIAKALGTGTVRSTGFFEFNSNNAARAVGEPSFTVTKTPIRIGADLKRARTLNVTQTATLQAVTNEDVQRCGDVSNTKRRAMVAAASPPCFATRVATAAAKFTGIGLLHANPSSPALVSACTDYANYIKAAHDYINDTSFLDGVEISDADCVQRAFEAHFEMKESEGKGEPTTSTPAGYSRGLDRRDQATPSSCSTAERAVRQALQHAF